jgi:hypothetical protein
VRAERAQAPSFARAANIRIAGALRRRRLKMISYPLCGAEGKLNIQRPHIRELGAFLDEGKARLGSGAHQRLDGFFGGVLRQSK